MAGRSLIAEGTDLCGHLSSDGSSMCLLDRYHDGLCGWDDAVVHLPLYLEERRVVLRWMLGEWEYANAKFNLVDVPDEQRDDHDTSMREHGFTSMLEEAFWFRQVTQYFKRAELMGVDTPQGRQALMKALNTLYDCCACMVRVHGLPPAPGVPSGEIGEWK